MSLPNFFAIIVLSLFTQIGYASISFVKSEFAIHIYTDVGKDAIIHIPINNVDFLELSQNEYNIKEKLGSYKCKKKSIQQATNINLLDISNIDEHTIAMSYSFDFNETNEQIHILIKETNGELKLSIQSNSIEDIDYISFNFIEETKAIFGGGIQFSHCNLKNKSFPLIVEENGVGRGDKGITFLAKLVGASGDEFTTYAPLPYFITNNQIEYQLETNGNCFWDVNFKNSSVLKFSLNSLDNSSINNLNISICKKSILQNISEENTAKRHMLKDWMYGFVLGVQGGKKRVDSIINIFNENDIEVSAIWIQDWVGKQQTNIGSRLQWNWKVNESVYPNIKQWIDSLNKKSIKVLAYINPYFVEGKSQAKVGLKNNYFVKTNSDIAYKFKAGGFNAYMVDLSNNDSRTWMKSIIKKEMLETGFDGWMCDFGEWLPFESNLNNNETLNHNNYPVEWLKLNWEAIKESDKEDFFVFNRSAYNGIKEIPSIMWLGDQMSNFGKNDGLASAINAYNSASLSGIPITHSDIGGYTAIKIGAIEHLRNEELLKRWIELESFTPLFRSHEGLKPEHMTQIYSNKNILDFFSKFNEVHTELIPYFKSVNIDLIENGIPMIRHPFLLYPEDENTYDLQYQFFVGDSLLVCPVYESGKNSIKAYLPEGNWQHFFTDTIFIGNEYYTINAPIGQPAVFWKVE